MAVTRTELDDRIGSDWVDNLSDNDATIITRAIAWAEREIKRAISAIYTDAQITGATDYDDFVTDAACLFLAGRRRSEAVRDILDMVTPTIKFIEMIGKGERPLPGVTVVNVKSSTEDYEPAFSVTPVDKATDDEITVDEDGTLDGYQP